MRRRRSVRATRGASLHPRPDERSRALSKQQLTQAEVDALINALRQSPGSESHAQEAGAAGRVWEAVGTELATVLTDLLNGAWRREIPVILVVRGEAVPETLGPATAVVRLGPPVGQRMWFLWSEAGPGASRVLDHFLADMATMLPWGFTHQILDPQTALPSDALLLPFRGVTPNDNVALTVGLESRHVADFAEHLGREREAREAAAAAGPGRAVAVDDLEVDASVYVGGGLYRLAVLSALRPGAILPLTTEVGEPAVIAIGSRVIAKGEIMVGDDGNLAVRVTEVLLGEEGRAATPRWLFQPLTGTRGVDNTRLRPPSP